MTVAYKKKLATSAKIGITIVILSLVVQLIQTAYFGWNWTPQSGSERMWDCVCRLLTIFGFVLTFRIETRHDLIPTHVYLSKESTDKNPPADLDPTVTIFNE